MMSIIETIRNTIKQHHEEDGAYNDMEEIGDLIFEYWCDKEIKRVDSDTEDRGKEWTEFESVVYKAEEENETAYFKVEKEVRKTDKENVVGAVVEEVIPKTKVETKYVSKNSIKKKDGLKIYVAHANSFDFRTELYAPLRNSNLNREHYLTLPHETSGELFDSKGFFKTCDLVIAEASYTATGLGIELGWAEILGIPVIVLHKEGTKASNSIRAVTKHIRTYQDETEMVSLIEEFIENM